jgi:hypothetical protein
MEDVDQGVTLENVAVDEAAVQAALGGEAGLRSRCRTREAARIAPGPCSDSDLPVQARSGHGGGVRVRYGDYGPHAAALIGPPNGCFINVA